MKRVTHEIFVRGNRRFGVHTKDAVCLCVCGSVSVCKLKMPCVRVCVRKGGGGEGDVAWCSNRVNNMDNVIQDQKYNNIYIRYIGPIYV
jgi:hypothetical protein